MSAGTAGPQAAALERLRVELRDEKLLVVDLITACEALMHEIERIELRSKAADPDVFALARAAIAKARGA